MGEPRVLRTYGHHRNRCVVSIERANIFESSSEDPKHVFSTSGSESGLGPSDSLNSVDYSLHAKTAGRKAKNKALNTFKASGNENVDSKKNKRKRQPRQHHATGSLFSSEKDTCSSSDCSTPSAKRIMRRALHDVSNDKDKKDKTKRQPARRKPNKTKASSPPKNHSSINFSEFDNYSLVISDSPPAQGGGRRKKKVAGGDGGVGTSTPCGENSQIKVQARGDFHAADISHISALNDSVDVEEGFSFGRSLSLGGGTPSSLFTATRNISSDPSGASAEGESGECENSAENLQRLEDSFASMRVGGRRLRTRKGAAQPVQLQFSSNSSDLSPVLHVAESPGEDHLGLECKIKERVQKLKESLSRSSAGSGGNLDTSGSLFDSPAQMELRGSAVTVSRLEGRAGKSTNPVLHEEEEDSHWDSATDSDSELESEALGSEDLSAIVEDSEDEETESEVDEKHEKGGQTKDAHSPQVEKDTKDEVNPSHFLCKDVRTEDSFMLYTLASTPCGFELEDSVVGDAEGEIGKSDSEETVVDTEDEGGEEDHLYGSEEDGDLSENAVSLSTLEVEDSLNTSSPVRYMLTSDSVSCADESSDALAITCHNEYDAERSILDMSGRKSLGINLTHSFAEILTPSKSNAQASARERILEQCGQTEPVPFTLVVPASALKSCVKVGEGVYGEVFRTKHKGHSVALKVIPIEGHFEVNDEPQKTFKEILPEIVISNELSRLREGEENNTTNFCPVKSVSLVKGRYPPELLKQWDIFHKKKSSENDRPDMFDEEQLFIVFEFGDGGWDLDGCKLRSAAQAVSVLQQVACALAVAEEVLSFEHRDLHVGNVLVQPTHHATTTVTLHNTPLFIDTQGIHVSIIDFTLSRLTQDGCTVFCDLTTDDSLFQGKGDYQFDIYRKMKEENNNSWEEYHPHSNVLWLHYLCDKLIQHKRFQETDRSHREALKRLRQAHSDLLKYHSVAEFVYDDPLFQS